MSPVLLPYQARALDILAQPATSVLVVEKSRRIGFTWGLAAAAVLKAASAKAEGGSDVLYISFSQDMTREFIAACSQFARAMDASLQDGGGFIPGCAGLDPGGAGTGGAGITEPGGINAFGIKFRSGFAIKALSSSPRSLRGRQGMVIIDEAAFVDDLAELLKAALSLTIWGGQVVVVSTHNGAANPFARLCQDVIAGKLPYRHMRVDLDDALRDGFFRRICAMSGKAWSKDAEDAWRTDIIRAHGDAADEELFCAPRASGGSWLSPALVEARMADGIPVLRHDLPDNYLHLPQAEQQHLLAPVRDAVALAIAGLDPNRRHALGGDFARFSDLSVFWVFAMDADMTRRTALVLELRRFPFAEQEDIVASLLAGLPQRIGAAFDATGSGAGFAEGLQRRQGFGHGITAVTLSQTWYRTHMPPLKRAFEDARIILPRDDLIAADFRLLQSINGVPGVPATRTGGQGAKRHGDSAIAAALGFYATVKDDGGGVLRFVLEG